MVRSQSLPHTFIGQVISCRHDPRTHPILLFTVNLCSHLDALRADCWAPDYCEPSKFEYKLCKLRLRGRSDRNSEFACPEGEYCEEIECMGKCWLPTHCWCEDRENDDQPHSLHFNQTHIGERHEYHGRMFCEDNACYKHPSTQWGICRPNPTEEEEAEIHEDDESPLPTGFHFWSADELLYNLKLHIDEDHHFSRPRVPIVPVLTDKEQRALAAAEAAKEEL